MSEGEAREGDKDINTHNTEGTESDLTGETRFASPAEALESLNTIGPVDTCLLYTSPSPRDGLLSRMPSSA